MKGKGVASYGSQWFCREVELRARRRLMKACMCFWVLAGAVVRASADEYEAAGEIEQTLFKADGGVQLIKRSRFTVFVKSSSWLIETIDHDESGKPLIARETGCVNGGEVHEVSGRVKEQAVPGGNRPRGSWNVASVVSNNVPVGQTDDYLVCHLWLVFASAHYFSSLSNNWLTPVYDLNASVSVNPSLKREARWDLISGPGSLPLKVVYLGAGGVTNATYSATGVTNAGPVMLPSGFVFEERVGFGYAPGPSIPGGTTPAYHVRKRAVAAIGGFRPVCSRSDLLPTATGKTMVIDRRLPQEEARDPKSMYIVQDGVKWLPVEAAKKANVITPAPRKHSHAVTAVFCGVVVLAAVALFFLVRGKPK
jgi:hypothetical protein